MPERGDSPSDPLVIFGIAGDLARKMAFRALYRPERRNWLNRPILGVAPLYTSLIERIVQPLLENPGQVHPYEPGWWGPEAALSLQRDHHGWQQPWLPQDKHAYK